MIGCRAVMFKQTIEKRAMKIDFKKPVSNFYTFYRDGFRQMTVGKKLWVLILIKLIIMFGILRMFFFPDVLKERYPNDTERASAVRSTLIERMGQT